MIFTARALRQEFPAVGLPVDFHVVAIFSSIVVPPERTHFQLHPKTHAKLNILTNAKAPAAGSDPAALYSARAQYSNLCLGNRIKLIKLSLYGHARAAICIKMA